MNGGGEFTCNHVNGKHTEAIPDGLSGKTIKEKQKDMVSCLCGKKNTVDGCGNDQVRAHGTRSRGTFTEISHHLRYA